MAIDTAQKRLSIMKVKKPFMPQGLMPSGSIDRYAAMWMYSGSDFTSPVVTVYVRAPITLSFTAYSTKTLIYAVSSTKELIFTAYSTKLLNFDA
jgi:hypothetical protein